MSIADRFERKKVFRDPSYLCSNHVPDEMLYRDDEMDKILDEVVYQFDGKVGCDLLVSGPPGTGKTHCLKKVCSEVNSYLEGEGLGGRMVYVPVKMKTVYELFVNLNKRFREYPSGGLHFDRVVSDLARYVSLYEENVVFVLDEVDKLKDTRYTDGDPFDVLVYHVSRLGEHVEGELDVMTIMVANEPRVRERMKGYSRSTFKPENVYFSSYDAEQLKEIILDRVEGAFLSGRVDESAIGWLAAKISKGDRGLRYALDVLKFAGKNMVDSSEGSIDIDDLQEAVKEIENDEVKTSLKGLGDVQFSCLVSLLLNEKRYGKGVNSEMFYKMYENVCEKMGFEARTYPYLRKYVMSKLEEQGLITSTVKGLGRGRGQVMVYHVKNLEEMVHLVSEVSDEEYGMRFRVNGEDV